MKKLYTLALAGVSSLCAFAQTPVPATETVAEEAVVADVAAVQPVAAAMEQAPALDGIFGTYTLYYKSGLAGANGNGKTLTITLAAKDGEYNVSVNGLISVGIPAKYDATAGTLTIPKILVAKDSEGDAIVAECFDWTDASPVPTNNPLVLTWADGRFVFPEWTVWGLGAHSILSEENGQVNIKPEVDKGYYFLSYYNFLYSTFDWKLLGDTEYSDGFFSPMFGETPAPKPVKVYQAATGAPVYKVEGALSLVTETANPMIIDATNPNMVAVPVQSSNITATGRGMTWYMSVTMVSQSKFTEANRCYPLVLKDGVISIPAQTCRFNWTEYAGNDGNWYYNSNTKATTLTIPGGAGIEDIVADDNAPVEYFNLQGLKVNNPEAGTLVIRRQGKKVEKVVF